MRAEGGHNCSPSRTSHIKRATWTWLGGLLLVVALALMAGPGCEKTAKDLVQTGNIKLVQKDYDEAIAKYEEALDKQPKNFDAFVGLGQAYAAKEEFEKAHEYFDKAKEMEISKARQQYMQEKYQELLLAEAKAMDPDKSPDKYEEKLREIVDLRKSTSPAKEAYLMLGEFYLGRGDELAKKKGTREDAIVYYERMNTIQTQPQLRTEALEKAEKLRREIFSEEFQENFKELKPELVENEMYDEDKERVKIEVAAEDKNINPRSDEAKEKIRKDLQRLSLLKLIQLTYKLAGMEVPEEIPNRFNYKSAEVVEEEIKRGEAKVVVSVKLEELEDVAYDSIVAPARKAKKKKAKKKKGDKEGGDEEKGGDGEEAEEGDNDKEDSGDDEAGAKKEGEDGAAGNE